MKNKLKGKYVIVYNLLCTGDDCQKDDKGSPVLYNSKADAIKEIFDDALTMFENYTNKELKEHFDLKRTDVNAMQKVFERSDSKEMEKFLEDHGDMTTSNEYPMKAEEFIQDRKAIFTGEGLYIQGTKL